MSADDEGFGPVQRGRGSRLRGSAVRPLEVERPPRRPERRPEPPPERRPEPRRDRYERRSWPEDEEARGVRERRRLDQGGAQRRPSDIDDGFGPPARGRDRGPRRERRGGGVVRALLTILLVLLLLPVAGVLGVAAYASSQIERVPVEGLSAAGGQMNILVIGSDSREGLSPEEAADLGTGTVAGKRTDTIFVLSVRGTQAAMLSFPRDLFVTRCDGTEGRINAAFVLGDGPSCISQTVQQFSGIPITHYMELSFLGFVQIVDAVGGVSVVLDEPISDVSAAIDLPAGCTRLDGRQALGFVRVRKIDDDLGRIGRQQEFLSELAAEIVDPATLLNVPRAVNTAGAVGDALIADEGFGMFDLLRMSLAGRGLATGGLPSYTASGDFATIGGAAVIVPDAAANEPLFASFRDGTIFENPPPQAEQLGFSRGRPVLAWLTGSGVLGQTPPDPQAPAPAADC